MTAHNPHQELVELTQATLTHVRQLMRRDVTGVPTVAQVVSKTTAPTNENPTSLGEVRSLLGDCQRCQLAKGRSNIVFGVGRNDADVMFVGEGPGRDEDIKGEPFVGAAGQLLTKMIEAMGLSRGEVYIANIVKCRPPNNRTPLPEEIATCVPFLHQQIRVISPKILIALGAVAAQSLLQTTTAVSRLRGKWATVDCGVQPGIPLMPTYHPAYLLRNPEEKKAAWSDLQAVMAKMAQLGISSSKGVTHA